MSAVPHGAFAARKVRQNMDKAFVWEDNLMVVKSGESKHERPKTPPQYPRLGQAVWETPLKYNSKLMNSIWGLYNRYSVHNFKKNTDDMEAAFFGDRQLTAAVSPLPATSNFVPGNAF